MSLSTGVWVAIGVALLIAEVATLAVFAIFIAVGAAAAALGSALGLPWPGQLVVFAGVTVIGIVLARPPIMAHLVSRSRPEVMSGLAGMVGEVGEVADAVAGHDLIGHLHLGGENWLSVSADGTVIEAGAKARIVGVDRTRLVLERVSGPAPPTAGP